MPGMAEHMRALAENTGWASLAAPDSAGVWRVALEHDLDAAFFALGDRKCVMRGVAAELPATAVEAEALCAEAARRQVAALRERSSILALEAPGQSLVPGEGGAVPCLVCFRSVPLSIFPDAFMEEVQGWLNDLSWWKAALGRAGQQDAGMHDMFSAGVFSGIRL
jgi:hypothetical protein